MDKFNSLFLVGFSGKILTEVIKGGEFVLDEDVSVFCPLHDRRIENRAVRRRNMMILNKLSLFIGSQSFMLKYFI
ncbi:MAG: hypothetical protein COS40_00560 [Deltaproteobacteria bacterium CG03_land_8_20_14_0_80_45_14]|nr:MAG: hypothetical protein COS40_00560 [Deltaproteobacteria bacterium CG03_land_8_20_14_0_80_45_14]